MVHVETAVNQHSQMPLHHSIHQRSSLSGQTAGYTDSPYLIDLKSHNTSPLNLLYEQHTVSCSESP